MAAGISPTEIERRRDFERFRRAIGEFKPDVRADVPAVARRDVGFPVQVGFEIALRCGTGVIGNHEDTGERVNCGNCTRCQDKTQL